MGANKGIIEKWDLWSKTIGNAESGFGPDPNPDQTEKSQKFKNKHFMNIVINACQKKYPMGATT